jgi:hypothetical protein
MCFCLIIFSECFPYLVSLFKYFLFSSLIHLSLYSVLFSLWHFGVHLGLLCVHLFLCLLIFFILKLLKCIFYILVKHV